MALITINDLVIGFRGPSLLDGVSCRIEPGQRIGLLGRNGAGKTTLMRILCGQVQPDHGEVILAPGTRVSLLPQDVPQQIHGPVHEVVATGLTDEPHDSETAWKGEHRVEQILSRMELDGAARFETLSSGMKRRVLLARSLVAGPDLLLLDEPTNHLDIEAIRWLEEFLLRWTGTLLFVTHDRMFLRRLATRILEIDGGRLFDWSCGYDVFLERKEAALAAEEKQNALFDKKLADEEVWIRQGIKARRTRNEGRVRALEQMRRERQERRSSPGKVRLTIQEGQRSGTLVAEVDQISFAYGGRPIFRDFSTTLMRGDKVGIVGPNGAGKTTLLRVLLGQLPPQQGSVRLGTNLQIAYFDQLREQLADDRTVQDNVGDGYETVKVGGQDRHIVGYLRDFLFTPERARTPVRFLSGGERNRVLLARLFAKPANVIVLDEPTNDLDTETLELLEERLAEFQGTVLLVSHDRAFLNNVVTTLFVFEDGNLRECVGGYDDWLKRSSQRAAQRSAEESAVQAAKDKTSGRGDAARVETAAGRRKLSYKERQELTGLPHVIEQLESDIQTLHANMAAPDYFRQSGEQLAQDAARLKQLENDLNVAYSRWETLSEMES